MEEIARVMYVRNEGHSKRGKNDYLQQNKNLKQNRRKMGRTFRKEERSRHRKKKNRKSNKKNYSYDNTEEQGEYSSKNKRGDKDKPFY